MKIVLMSVAFFAHTFALPQYGAAPPPLPEIKAAPSQEVQTYQEPSYEPAVPVYDNPPAASNPSPKQVSLPSEPGMPYDFEWGVNDKDSGNQFNHQETSDGDITRGSYRVLLPDGRTQVVTFTADAINGYNAIVSYER